MPVNGERFLELSRANGLTITDHALTRIREHTGFEPTCGLASVLFSRSRQLKAHQMRLLGYRPAYARRVRAGAQSWYFRFCVFGQELIAVVEEGGAPGELVWVTTYGHNDQTEHYRIADFELATAS